MAELQGLEFLNAYEIKDKTCDLSRPFAFISYSHDPKDTEIVRNVFSRLYDAGYNLWIDTANIPHNGEEWSDSAFYALNSTCCEYALFFRSESSVISENILDELKTIKTLKHIKRVVIDIW